MLTCFRGAAELQWGQKKADDCFFDLSIARALLREAGYTSNAFITFFVRKWLSLPHVYMRETEIRYSETVEQR